MRSESCHDSNALSHRCMSALQRDHGNKWRDKVVRDMSRAENSGPVRGAGEPGDKKKMFNQWKEEGNNHVKQVIIVIIIIVNRYVLVTCQQTLTLQMFALLRYKFTLIVLSMYIIYISI